MATDKTSPPIKSIGLNHRARIGENKEAPLVFLCHGRGGNVDVMWSFRRAVPDHYHLISLEAPMPDVIGGFSWWMVGEDSLLEKAKKATSLALSSMKNCIAAYGLKSKTIIGIGFSQGGALLSLISQEEPSFFQGVGVLCGFVIKDNEANNPIPGLPKYFFANGTKDKILPIEKAKVGIAWFKNLGASVEDFEEDVGHKVGVNGMRRLKEWVKSFD